MIAPRKFLVGIVLAIAFVTYASAVEDLTEYEDKSEIFPPVTLVLCFTRPNCRGIPYVSY